MGSLHVVSSHSHLLLHVRPVSTLTETLQLSKRPNPSRPPPHTADLLPWALIAHCAFGLWMHTYFKVESTDIISQSLQAGASGLQSSVQAVVTQVQDSQIWKRITQPNGVALLLLFVALTFWMLIGRWGVGGGGQSVAE